MILFVLYCSGLGLLCCIFPNFKISTRHDQSLIEGSNEDRFDKCLERFIDHCIN